MPWVTIQPVKLNVMDWFSVLVNLGSGGIGVLITLALTGFWNWRDRRETRGLIERDAIVTFVNRTTDITTSLWAEFDFEKLMAAKENSVERRRLTAGVIGQLQRLNLLNSELKTVVKHDAVDVLLDECTGEVAIFYGLFGLGPEEDRTILGPEKSYELNSREPARTIRNQIGRIVEVYNKNNSSFMSYAGSRVNTRRTTAQELRWRQKLSRLNPRGRSKN